MAHWKQRLYVGDEWEMAKNGEISIAELGGIIAKKLRNLHISDFELADIIDGLEQVTNIEEFDEIWDQLYDWGDAGHRLWVATWA